MYVFFGILQYIFFSLFRHKYLFLLERSDSLEYSIKLHVYVFMQSFFFTFISFRRVQWRKIPHIFGYMQSNIKNEYNEVFIVTCHYMSYKNDLKEEIPRIKISLKAVGVQKIMLFFVNWWFLNHYLVFVIKLRYENCTYWNQIFIRFISVFLKSIGINRLGTTNLCNEAFPRHSVLP